MTQTRNVPKQWYLTKTETIISFNNWKENQIYSLNIDKTFKPYLRDGATWGKKTAASPTRGYVDDGNEVVDATARQTKEQKCATLDLMLGQLANWATVISRNQITRNSISLVDVWNKIREHYGFLNTGARFLDLSTIKLDIGERPEDLYQRLLSFFEDNLLTTGSSVTHHGETSTSDEEVTPTVENFTVFLWLDKIHVGLPGLVKQRYGTELRNKTVASIKSEISLALDSLLEELKTTENTSVLRVQHQRGRGRGFRGNYNNNRGNSNNNPNRQSRFCCLCRGANRPDFDSHFLSQCRYLPEADRRRMNPSAAVRNVEAIDFYAYDNEGVVQEDDVVGEEYYYDDYDDNNLLDYAGAGEVDEENDTVPDTNTGTTPDDRSVSFSDEVSVRRVMVRKSPSLNCFYKHHPVFVCLDSGAESNLISAKCAKKLDLIVVKGTQGALQADSKTPLKVLGEVKNVVLIRGAQSLSFEGLVVQEDIGEIVGGEPFLEVNDIAIRSSKKEIRIRDSEAISYGQQ